MMQILEQWKVTIRKGSGEQTFWMNENFLNNVLQSLAKLQFSQNGLDQPVSLTIELMRTPTP